jgi:hypothetical protein
MVFYTRAVALLNNVREVALCETLDRIGLHSFSGGDIESGVSQVKSRTLVHTIKKLCVIT